MISVERKIRFVTICSKLVGENSKHLLLKMLLFQFTSGFYDQKSISRLHAARDFRELFFFPPLGLKNNDLLVFCPPMP